MKITAYDGEYTIDLSLGTSTVGDQSTLFGGDVAGAGGDLAVIGMRREVSIASNLIPVLLGDVLTIIQASPAVARFATPSNTGVSYGSNSTRVAKDPAAGAATAVSRADHIHDGIGTITASSSNTLQRGTVNLRPGSGIALNLSNADGAGNFDTVEIANIAQGGGGGGGGGTAIGVPNVYNATGSNGLSAQNPALTIPAAASGHRLIVGLNLVGRGATSITCTNTTFTQMWTYTSAGGSRYEVWVGVVAGGSSGTTLTVNTASSNFASIVVMETDEPLTPTAGTVYNAAKTGNAVGIIGFGPLSGITAGHFVVALAGADNTTTAWTMLQLGQPGFWYRRNASGTGLIMGIMYAPAAGDITCLAENGGGSLASYTIIGEVT